MDLTTIDPLWWIVLGVLVVIVIGLLIWSGRQKANRTDRLKGQFKSEYDRTASSSSKKDTEEDLERRSERRSRVDLADLEESDAEGLEQQVDDLLRSFVDGPQGAARGMTQLVGRVASARGYVSTEGSVLDLVSVDHPEQVAAMRRSETEMEKAKGADLTEASRRTFLDARVLAERLLAEGRAGQLGADESDTPPAAGRPPRSDDESDRSSDVPPPPPVGTDSSTAERDRGTDARSSVGPPRSDDPQSGTTTGGSPRR